MFMEMADAKAQSCDICQSYNTNAIVFRVCRWPHESEHSLLLLLGLHTDDARLFHPIVEDRNYVFLEKLCLK